MSEIEIEIDNKKCKAEPNQMVIQIADREGIYIPRFCYHKHLSIAANCRMCLVEVEKAPKPLPACATPVTPGMKVFTRSPKAIAAQKAVMEFLLINHPLDCPICDQGGECELQDLSMGYGTDSSQFIEGKRAVGALEIGPLIATEMTRCIQCTRCVRFGNEVAGLPELGAVNRGEHMEITTYVQQAIHSEISGNIIDLCPVGALTSKPYRFTARPWELDQHKSIAPHDCLGTHIHVHTRYGKVMRVVANENPEINETWISDRDRFSYEALDHEDRLANPLIKIKDQWQETDWATALEFAAKELMRIKNQSGGDALAALASPNSTVEEFFLLKKLLQSLGSDQVEHRLRQVDVSDQNELFPYPRLDFSITDLSQADTILLVGSHLQKEQPLAAVQVRKAFLNKANILSVNLMDYRFSFDLAEKNIVAPQQFTRALAGIAKILQGKGFDDVEPSAQDQAIAKRLSAGKNVYIVLGALAMNHPEASLIRRLSRLIANLTQAKFGILTEGANAAGAWIAGAISSGVPALLKKSCAAYVLLNAEPESDFADETVVTHALKKAEFVLSLSLFKNPLLEQHANVILPMAAFTETSGTFVNTQGQWQTFQGIAQPLGNARPAWKILRVLGNLIQGKNFEYTSSDEVRKEVQALQPIEKKIATVSLSIPPVQNTLVRIGEIPIYATDSLVRRAKALQETQKIIEGELAVARVHPLTAKKLGAEIRVGQTSLPVVSDARVPEGGVFVPGGIEETKNAGELFEVIRE